MVGDAPSEIADLRNGVLFSGNYTRTNERKA